MSNDKPTIPVTTDIKNLSSFKLEETEKRANRDLAELKSARKEGRAIVKSIKDADCDEDFRFVRDNLRELIGSNNDTLERLIRLCEESMHPRSFEVLAMFVKTQADINKDLLDVHERLQKLQGGSAGSQPQAAMNNNINQAVFVGSTADLNKFLEERENDNRQ